MLFTDDEGKALYSQEKQDCERIVAQIMNFLIAKFRRKLKKLGKSARLFRWDLNYIPHDFTVEVRNRFKGLDLIDRVTELWMEVHDTV